MFFQDLCFTSVSTVLNLFCKYSLPLSLTKYDFLRLCSIKYIHNIKYKMYVQNEKNGKIVIFCQFFLQNKF